jgi:hypothetical protein
VVNCRERQREGRATAVGEGGEERTVGQSSRLELAWQTAAVTIARSSSWSMGAAAGFGIWSLGHTKEFGIAFPRVI